MSEITPGYRSTTAGGFLLAALSGIALPQIEPASITAALVLCPPWVQVAYPLAGKVLSLAATYLAAHSYASHRRQLRLNENGAELDRAGSRPVKSPK